MRLLITCLNRFLNQAFDAFLTPLAYLGRTAEVLAVAVVLGVLVALVFGRLVDRERLRRARNDLRAALLEIWLYRRDPRVVLQAEKALLVANLSYLRAFLLPLAGALLLVAPLLVQSHFRFGLTAVPAGAEVLLTVELDPDRDRLEGIGPKVSWARGAGRLSPPVRVLTRQRVVWRVRPEGPGPHLLHVAGGGQEVEFPLRAGRYEGSVGAARAASPYWHLLQPRTDPLGPDSVFRRIWLEYPDADAGWLFWLTAGSLAAALVTNRLLGRREPQPLYAGAKGG